MRTTHAQGHAAAPRRLWRLLGLAALTVADGCGGKTPAVQTGPALAIDSEAAAKVDRTRCDTAGKQVVEADTNRDQRPDVWKLYQTLDSGGQKMQQLTCKQVDLNYDGKLDIVYHYEGGGPVSFEEFDLDFDGRFDLWSYYQNGKRVREEMDTNYDRRPDFTKYYEGDKLVRIERDNNNDGRVDEWMYYEGGRIDRIGYDTTGTGRVDKWDRAPEGDTASGGGAGESGTAAPAGPETAPGSTPAAAATAPAAPATPPAAPATAPAAPATPPAAKK